ncbi:hypothetical protein LWI28_013488 [Acer negundo]|uniref:F-box domain-containing protein n=1 Tax=Acer negundo TaxID=4023 RepID=A0AAD5J5U5_ACENE|nr:hypothetical protein LWI28_013488 [Acer negundo]
MSNGCNVGTAAAESTLVEEKTESRATMAGCRDGPTDPDAATLIGEEEGICFVIVITVGTISRLPIPPSLLLKFYSHDIELGTNWVHNSLVSEPGSMETRTKSNTEFRNEVSEALARHESGFDNINDRFGNMNDRFGDMDDSPKILRTSSGGDDDDDGDRLSSLPEPIIHYIFSFLKTIDVFRASAVSRKWRYLCVSIPYLNFDIHTIWSKPQERWPLYEINGRFKDFVNWVLMFQKSSIDIQKLRLRCLSFSDDDHTLQR